MARVSSTQGVEPPYPAANRECVPRPRRRRSRFGLMARRGQGEGSTDRFGDYYRHRITLPDGRRLALYARTREELNEKIETAIAARARGEPVTSGRYPYGPCLDPWLA